MTTLPEGSSVLIEVFWKSGVALSAALCINMLLRKQSADVRRLVLSTAIVAMFLAALALPILPRWSAVMPSWLELTSPEAPAAIWSNAATASSSGITVPPIPTSRTTIQDPRPHSWAWFSRTIPLLWFVGSALLLLRFTIGLYGLRRIRNASQPVTDHAVLAWLENAPRRGVMLLQNNAIAAPVTWGILRPVILVPSGFGQLPVECRNAVLCHELAHIQGYDFFLRSLTEIARALIWFQPLIWIASRQLHEEQELACDNRVLAAGGKPSAYAKLLLDWDLRPGLDSLIAVGIAHRSCLKRRLYALLDRDQHREPAAGTVVLATWLLGLVAAFPLAAMGFTHAVAAPLKAPLAFHSAISEPVKSQSPATIPDSPQSRIQFAQARAATAVPPQSAAPVPPAVLFVSTSALVIEDVTVIGQDGRSIEGLVADDFAVTEDDKQMHVGLAEYQKLSASTGYYVVTYYTTNSRVDGAYRTVKIALKSSNARLDYRAGYYGLSPTPAGEYLPRTTSSGVVPPALLLKVDPEYTEEARKAKYSGTVSLDVDVDATGRASKIAVVGPLGMGLDESAVRAVSRWHFTPATKGGAPVAAQARVWATFQVL